MLDFIWDIFGEDFLVYAGVNKVALEVLQSYFLGRAGRLRKSFSGRTRSPPISGSGAIPNSRNSRERH